jgi:hypothetical protein
MIKCNMTITTMLLVLIISGCDIIYAQEQNDAEKAKRIEAIEKLNKEISDTKSASVILKEDASNPSIKMIIYNKGTHADELLALLKIFPDMEACSIINAKISKQGAECLPYFKNILDLRLINTSFDDNEMVYISNLINIETLGLDDNNITDEGLREIKNLKKISCLILRNTNIHDEGIKTIFNLPELESLTLDNTRITDKGLLYLNGHKKLRFLSLFGTAVTVDGLLKIKDLPELSYLGVYMTEYSKIKEPDKKQEIKDQLKKNLPKLKDIDDVDMFRRTSGTPNIPRNTRGIPAGKIPKSDNNKNGM